MTEKAIINYVNLLSSTPIQSIFRLASGEIFCQLVSIVQPSKIDISKIIPADSWISKLSNLKLVVRTLQIYSEEQLGSKFDSGDLDLLKIAKFQQREEILKLFEMILNLFMNCKNKQLFIKKIMELQEESQHYITDIIKRMIEPSSQQHIQEKSTTNESALLEKLDELQHQIQILKKQKQNIVQNSQQKHKQNEALRKQINKLTETINFLNGQLSENQTKSSHAEIFDHGSLIESLKQKLIIQSVEHQKQKIKMSEEIELMRGKLDRIEDVQSKVQIYQQRASSLSQRLSQLEEQLLNTRDQLTRKSQLVGRLQENNRILSQKFNKEELQRISQQMDAEKLNIRNSLKKPLTIDPRTSETLLQQYSKRQSQQELNIANRRIKTLQKQLAKSNLKAEKVVKLQSQKKQLEDTFLAEMHTKKQEIDILSHALIGIRLHHFNCSCKN